ncbi:MAG: OmpA family protein [Xanthobacteraceae bacterium]
MVDFLGSFRRSAQYGLPIYRLVGHRGYIWSASFDLQGQGHLRFFAIERPAVSPGPANQEALPHTKSEPLPLPKPDALAQPKPQVSPPSKTEALPPPKPQVGKPDVLLDAGLCDRTGIESVSKEIEEQESRKCRLQQLGSQTFRANPKFYEWLVKKNDVAGLPTDIPVLRVVFEEKVFFDTARWDILPQARPALDLVAEALRKEPSGTVLFVAGHTDSRGSEDYNLDLSVKRASSVAQALAQRTVGDVRIWRIGFGKGVPLRPNDSNANMSVNRRVEFILTSRFDAGLHAVSKLGKYLCADGSEVLPEFCKDRPAVPQQVEAVSIPTGSMREEPVVLRIPVEPPQEIEVPLELPPAIEMGSPLQ